MQQQQVIAQQPIAIDPSKLAQHLYPPISRDVSLSYATPRQDVEMNIVAAGIYYIKVLPKKFLQSTASIHITVQHKGIKNRDYHIDAQNDVLLEDTIPSQQDESSRPSVNDDNVANIKNNDLVNNLNNISQIEHAAASASVPLVAQHNYSSSSSSSSNDVVAQEIPSAPFKKDSAPLKNDEILIKRSLGKQDIGRWHNVIVECNIHHSNSTIIFHVETHGSSFDATIIMERKLEHFHTEPQLLQDLISPLVALQLAQKSSLLYNISSLPPLASSISAEPISSANMNSSLASPAAPLANSSSSSLYLHWIVMVHGNHSKGVEMEYLGECIRYNFPRELQDRLLIQYSTVNEMFNTHAGVDVCGKKLAEEMKVYFSQNIVPLLKSHQKIQKIQKKKEEEFNGKVLLSLVSHSLGGLFSRSAIKHLFEDPFVFQHLIPCSFLSLHSPHLGSRRPVQEAFFRQIVAKGVDFYLDKMIGKSGSELGLRDHLLNKSEQAAVKEVGEEKSEKSELNAAKSKQEENMPLLLKMSLENSEYIKALQLFKFKTLLSGTHYDLVVPFCSSAISHYNPYKAPEYGAVGAKVISHEGFSKAIKDKIFVGVKEEVITPFKSVIEGSNKGIDEYPEYDKDNDNLVEFNSKMLVELQKVNWRRVNVEYYVGASTQVVNGTVHGMPINKVSPLSILVGKDNDGAKISVATSAKVVVMDHITHLAELTGVTL